MMVRMTTVVVAAFLPDRQQSTEGDSRKNGRDDGNGNSDGNSDKDDNIMGNDNRNSDNKGDGNRSGSGIPARQTTISYKLQQKKW